MTNSKRVLYHDQCSAWSLARGRHVCIENVPVFGSQLNIRSDLTVSFN